MKFVAELFVMAYIVIGVAFLVYAVIQPGLKDD